MHNIIKLKTFVNMALPLVYDDTLSYYEEVCKVVHKLNEIIDNVNSQNEYIEDNFEIIRQGITDWETDFTSRSQEEWQAWFTQTLDDLADWKEGFEQEFNDLVTEIEQITTDAVAAKNAAETAATNAGASATAAAGSATAAATEALKTKEYAEDVAPLFNSYFMLDVQNMQNTDKYDFMLGSTYGAITSDGSFNTLNNYLHSPIFEVKSDTTITVTLESGYTFCYAVYNIDGTFVRRTDYSSTSPVTINLTSNYKYAFAIHGTSGMSESFFNKVSFVCDNSYKAKIIELDNEMHNGLTDTAFPSKEMISFIKTNFNGISTTVDLQNGNSNYYISKAGNEVTSSGSSYKYANITAGVYLITGMYRAAIVPWVFVGQTQTIPAETANGPSTRVQKSYCVKFEEDGILYTNNDKSTSASASYADSFPTDWYNKIGEIKKETSNYLCNKKWVACGDSFTAGDFGNAPVDNWHITDGIYKGEKKVYPYIIGNRNYMTIVNEAIGGSTMTHIDGRTNAFSDTRYTEIPEDADYITLKFGINDDSSHQNVPIGTIDDATNETFYGAWNIVLNYLIEHHPNAKIGIIVTNGSKLDIVNATIAVAEKFGISYLNEATDKQCSYMFRSNRTDVDVNIRNLRNENWYVSNVSGSLNLHPSAEAHEYESTVVENWLRSL